MNIVSGNVTVFPTAKARLENNNYGKLLYEDNITNLIRQIVDVDGFIISAPKEIVSPTYTLSEDLIFNLYGYYFKISEGTSFAQILSSGDVEKLYAKIVLINNPPELSGQDTIYSDTAIRYLKENETENIIGIPESEYNKDDSEYRDTTKYTTIDSVTLYTGLEIIGVDKNTYPKNSNTTKYLQLYTKNGDNKFSVREKSKFKFDSSTFQIDGIDGKC